MTFSDYIIQKYNEGISLIEESINRFYKDDPDKDEFIKWRSAAFYDEFNSLLQNTADFLILVNKNIEKLDNKDLNEVANNIIELYFKRIVDRLIKSLSIVLSDVELEKDRILYTQLYQLEYKCGEMDTNISIMDNIINRK